MHLLISAYSARNRSDLLVFSQKATPRNWRMERYVVTVCQKRFPSQFPPMYRVETQWWKATAARCPSRWTNTPNQWNPQINERIFQKKNVMSQSPHETEHCKNKKTLEMQRICHASTRKCVHVHGNYMIQTPSESSLVSFRAFFLGSKLTSAFHSWLGAKHRSYWASSEVSGDEASRSVTWSKIGCAGLAIEKSRMLLMVRLVKR